MDMRFLHFKYEFEYVTTRINYLSVDIYMEQNDTQFMDLKIVQNNLSHKNNSNNHTL